MKNINKFNFKRVIYLTNRQLATGAKPCIIGMLAAGGFLLSIFILHITLVTKGSFNLNAYSTIGFVIFYLGGYIYTSNIFSELQSPLKSHFYLTLPAKPEEKLISAWLLSSLFYSIVALLTLFIISFIISGVLVLFFNESLMLFDPFAKISLKAVGGYMITQTIFLLGSVYFKKFNFLKTILSLFVIYLIIVIWMVVLVFTVVKPWDIVFSEAAGDIEFQFNYLQDILLYAIGPFFIIVSYIRLKERQV